MDLTRFIGLPIDEVKDKLDELSIKYKIIENNSKKTTYDILLVVKAEKKDDFVELTTDKFLLSI